MAHKTIWFHGTSEETFKKIQKEGKLWGVQKNGRRYTNLAMSQEEASMYGEVTLRVDYDPVEDLFNNNFDPDSLEIRVSTPILKTSFRRI